MTRDDTPIPASAVAISNTFFYENLKVSRFFPRSVQNKKNMTESSRESDYEEISVEYESQTSVINYTGD